MRSDCRPDAWRIVGEFTNGGAAAIYFFGGFAGVALGIAYAVGRALLPSGVLGRTIVFTLGTTAFMVGQIVRDNREDFSSPAGDPQPRPRRGLGRPDRGPGARARRAVRARPRAPARCSRKGSCGLGLAAFGLFALTGIMIAQTP